MLRDVLCGPIGVPVKMDGWLAGWFRLPPSLTRPLANLLWAKKTFLTSSTRSFARTGGEKMISKMSKQIAPKVETACRVKDARF